MKQSLTIILIFVSVIICKGQACSNMHIRGPLLNCSTPVTFQYHVLNGLSSGVWSVLPANAGTIVPSGTNATVTWTQLGGALVFKDGACSDTIFMQGCCNTDLPTATISIKDLSTITTPNLATFASNLGGTIAGNIITVNNKTLFIQGELNMEGNTKLVFNNCTLIMGSGAVFYAMNLEFTGGSVTARCNMWQGFRVGDHGTLKATGTTFSDAEYCISIFDKELALQIANCTFTKNFISIYSTPYSLGNVFSYYANSALTTYIKNNTFSGSDPITLPNYNGQAGKPLGQRPFAGMLFNDLKAVNVFSISLPLSLDPTTFNSFNDLNFGIYTINSYLDVYNCRFNHCQPIVAYIGTQNSNGCGIYCKVNIGSANKVLHAGGANNGGYNRINLFTDCRRGIITNNGVNSFITQNFFVHPYGASSVSGTHISLFDADNMTINIQANTFRDFNLVTAGYPLGYYASNGIVITSATQTRKFLNITDNIFENEKTSIYLTNCRGVVYQDPTFIITQNLISNTISAAQMAAYNSTHVGIWMNAVSNGFVYNNTFHRVCPLSTEPSNFATLYQGMNVVNSTNVSIAENDFIENGTSMRFVSNCSGTTLKCNTMISNIQGVSLAAANMTPQGLLGEGWDNKWDGFPTSSTIFNRVDGIVVNRIDWFSRDQSNTTSNYNRFSPEPVNFLKINPQPNQASPGCAVPGTGGTGSSDIRTNKITRVIRDNIEYDLFPEASRYLDKEYAFYALKEDTILKDSLQEFGDYYDSLYTSNFGKFDEADELYQNGELDEALAQLDLIVDDNLIEHNKIFTRKIAINQKKYDTDFISEDDLAELESIAWTNAWLGGSGVFTARHLLNEQVIDIENNLRVRNPFSTIKSFNSNIAIYPNPTSDNLTIFYDMDMTKKLSIQISDFLGRTILKKELESNIVDVHAIPNGTYSISFYSNNEFLNSMRLIILHQ